MRRNFFAAGVVLASLLYGATAGAFGQMKEGSPKQYRSQKKGVKKLQVKRRNLQALQVRADADLKRYQNEGRLQQFQQMQQAQQRGHQQLMQSQTARPDGRLADPGNKGKE